MRETSKKGNFTETPRNSDHVRNIQKKLKRKKGAEDDLKDVLSFMRLTNEEVVSDMVMGSKFRVIQKHLELIEHFNEVRGTTELVFGYDTTFRLAEGRLILLHRIFVVKRVSTVKFYNILPRQVTFSPAL